MVTGKLTDRHLKAWHTQGSPIPAQADGGGLYFRIHQSGMPQWYFRYQLAGRQRWMFLGNYPDVSLADARKMARAARVQLDRGEDVAAARQQQKAERQRAYTVADLADEWYTREVEPRVKYPEIVRRVLDKYVLPKIGRLPAASVLPRDADAVLSAIAKHAPTLNVALGRVRHGLEHFTIHDMPRTARTQLAALGVSREVAERALNHKLRGVEGIHNRHDYFEERKAALAQWANMLARLEQGVSKVVPIRARA